MPKLRVVRDSCWEGIESDKRVESEIAGCEDNELINPFDTGTERVLDGILYPCTELMMSLFIAEVVEAWLDGAIDRVEAVITAEPKALLEEARRLVDVLNCVALETLPELAVDSILPVDLLVMSS